MSRLSAPIGERLGFSAAPAPEEIAWPPLTEKDALRFRWAKVDELQHIDRTLSRMTRDNTARPKVEARRKQVILRIQQVNEYIAGRQRKGWPGAEPSLRVVQHDEAGEPTPAHADPDQEPPTGLRPMSNADYLLYVARQRAAGQSGPVPRPLVRA